jgi:hypothetical protein
MTREVRGGEPGNPRTCGKTKRDSRDPNLRDSPLGPHPLTSAAIWLEIGGAVPKTVLRRYGPETHRRPRAP